MCVSAAACLDLACVWFSASTLAPHFYCKTSVWPLPFTWLLLFFFFFSSSAINGIAGAAGKQLIAFTRAIKPNVCMCCWLWCGGTKTKCFFYFLFFCLSFLLYPNSSRHRRLIQLKVLPFDWRVAPEAVPVKPTEMQPQPVGGMVCKRVASHFLTSLVLCCNSNTTHNKQWNKHIDIELNLKEAKAPHTGGDAAPETVTNHGGCLFVSRRRLNAAPVPLWVNLILFTVRGASCAKVLANGCFHVFERTNERRSAGVATLHPEERTSVA